MTETARSLARIDGSDLLRLAALAAEAEAGLFARHPSGAGRYAGRLLCRALCQGAALHYLDGRNGVKDFDVWSFYAALAEGPFPYRWRGTADYGPSKFGRWTGDRRRTPDGGLTSSGDHCPRRSAPTRRPSCATICRRRIPHRRRHWRPRQSSCLLRNTPPASASGPSKLALARTRRQAGVSVISLMFPRADMVGSWI